jgi:hypothetical protein
MELAIAIVAPLALISGFAWIMTREDARLRRRARRYRELELEGIEELRPDPYPEEERVEGGFLREPNGRRTDTGRVLHEELERAREHTRAIYRRRARARSRRGGKGASCLV